MSITTELREWWVRKFPVMDKELHKDFTAIADRIDAEHERQLEVLYRDMSDAEYVKLPVDADGEPIKFGDEVEWRRTCSEDYSVTEHGTVDGLEIYQVNDEIFTHISINRNGYSSRMPPKELRHVKQPTVKDVLRQFLGECESAANLGYDEVPQEVFDDYAAKLQLRGDAE